MASLHFREPKPGAKLQVIGAGLPRTGTNSFCAALEILLDGPCYHAGVQWGANGATDERHIKTMISAAGQYPYDASTRAAVQEDLARLLNGYVAVADPPLSILYAELLQMSPDAKVIVTVRERETWTKSMLDIIKTSQPALAGLLFFWLPSVRWLPKFATALTNLFYQKHGVEMKDPQSCIAVWDRHKTQLEETVPKRQLFYFNVKDGWEPLCEILDRPIPDVPFPRLNDARDLEYHFKNLAARGLARWALFVVVFSAILCGSALLAHALLSSPPALVHNSYDLISRVGAGMLVAIPILLLYI